jgi:acyl carrier protein
MNHVTEELRTFIVNNFLLGDSDDLRDDTSFLDNGIIDSTGVLELLGFLDSHFGIRVEDNEIVPENLDSLYRLTNFVQKRLVQVPDVANA